MRSLYRRRDGLSDDIALRPIIDEVLLLHNPKLRELSVAVTVSVQPQVPMVPGDRVQIRQVLMNLVSNALDSMESDSEQKRELEIHVSLTEGAVAIAVEDRGHGIADAERVFTPFFTTKDSGMGMGLRICKTIVEAHRGRLWAEPRSVRGTRFLFTLPVKGA
jgi:signal transduction histidine kinase